MKLILRSVPQNMRMFCLIAASCLLSFTSTAQVCSNPAQFIYGLTNVGMIHKLNVSNANAQSSALNPAYTGNAPSYSNALGYDNANGKFYYFKRNSFAPPQEFVSFDAATNTYAMLAPCPAGASTIVNLGCVTANGLYYYCVDAAGTLFCYNIVLNTWTTITTVMYDQYGNNLSSVFSSHIYGDIAFDGLGNLWLLPTSATQYGLYKINGPLPTSPVASVTARELKPPTTATPNGNTIGGIAFNQTGQIFVSTNTPDNKLFLLNNNYTFTYIGQMNVDALGNDLTSCNFPFGILPVTWKSFTAELKSNNQVLLTWETGEEMNNKGYHVEHSSDGTTWEELAFKPGNAKQGGSKYSFADGARLNGKHYYRIRQEDFDGVSTYSEVRTVDIKSGRTIAMGPNPTKNILHIQLQTGAASENSKALIFDQSGRKLKEANLVAGFNSIDIHSLPSGNYVVKVGTGNGDSYIEKIVKE